MITTIGLGAFFLGLFLITWIVIACNAPETYSVPVLPEPEWKRNRHFSEVLLEDKVKHLQDENYSLKEQIRFLERNRCPIKCMYANQTCHHCEIREVKVYAKTPDEQKIVELLTKGMKPLEELKSEFGIK